MKFYKYNAGHMTKMAVMLVYGIISQNQRNDYKEAWYVASGTPALHSLFKL